MSDRTKRIILIAVAIIVPAGALIAALVYWKGRKGPLTDAAVIEKSADALSKWEGNFAHLYLDTKGLPTTGIGNLLRTATDAAKLPWFVGGRRATAAEIAADFTALLAAPWAKAARFYEKFTRIRLPAAESLKLVKRRLAKDYLPALHSRFPNWDKLPGPAQLALVDMMYSLGPGAFDKYKTMTHAVQRGDFRAAALASQRNGARQSRNEYVRDLFYSAAGDRAVA